MPRSRYFIIIQTAGNGNWIFSPQISFHLILKIIFYKTWNAYHFSSLNPLHTMPVSIMLSFIVSFELYFSFRDLKLPWKSILHLINWMNHWSQGMHKSSQRQQFYMMVVFFGYCCVLLLLFLNIYIILFLLSSRLYSWPLSFSSK